MHDPIRFRFLKQAGIAGAVILLALPLRQARADDLVGLYFGGGIGESWLQATLPGFGTGFNGTSDQTHFAFKGFLGVRPISLLGAEVDYVDLGEPGNGNAGYSSVGLKMHGAAAYGMVYLPLVPVVDVYLKAGLARLQSTVSNGFAPVGPSAFAFDRANTSASEGLGVQYALFGSLAVRGDYSFFNAAGGHQSMLTADVTYTFF